MLMHSVESSFQRYQVEIMHYAISLAIKQPLIIVHGIFEVMILVSICFYSIRPDNYLDLHLALKSAIPVQAACQAASY